LSSIQIRALKVFCDVVRRRSFSQAATDHGITQSAASQTVQTIEEYVGAQLIDRSKRPFILTVEGQQFFDGISAVVRQFDHLVSEIRKVSEELCGQVSVASIYSIGLSYLPDIELTFESLHRSASHSVQLAHPEEVYRMVEVGSVDFGLVSFPESSNSIQTTHWRDERMIMVASPRHRLASADSITCEELSSCALVAFAPHLRIRQEIDKHLRANSIQMRTVIELDNLDSVRHAVLVNSGLAMVPEAIVAEELASGALCQIKSEALSMTRPLGLIQRRNMPLSPTARGFAELLLGSVSQESPGKAESKNASEDAPNAPQTEGSPSGKGKRPAATGSSSYATSGSIQPTDDSQPIENDAMR
jgi:DNA-binding transcriptional LysR family regulator